MDYLPRIADAVLKDRLKAFGAVLVEGPKWIGKTTTAKQQAQSVLSLQDPDRRAENLTTAETMPSLLLKGRQPRLIDEWQDAPQIWDAVRIAVDNSGSIPGQYILSHSARAKQATNHSAQNRLITYDIPTNRHTLNLNYTY